MVPSREGREGEKINTFKTVQLLFSSKSTTDVNHVKVCTNYFFNKGFMANDLGRRSTQTPSALLHMVSMHINTLKALGSPAVVNML